MTDSTKPKSQTQRAVEDMRALIFSGDLAAGTDHLEQELAQRLGMSRTPVREATLLLEAQGLLEVRARKGVRIQALSPVDMAEIYEVLTELESVSAYRAAKAGLSRSQLSQLAGSIDRMEAALRAEDREAWATADAAFHDELVALGGNSRIQSIVAMYNDQVRRARAMTLHMRPMPHQSNHDHRALYDAIARGDADAARAIHHSHRAQAQQMMVSLLKQFGLKRV
jgi:DNA-binding GntR family transcriptional regulator